MLGVGIVVDVGNVEEIEVCYIEDERDHLVSEDSVVFDIVEVVVFAENNVEAAFEAVGIAVVVVVEVVADTIAVEMMMDAEVVLVDEVVADIDSAVDSVSGPISCFDWMTAPQIAMAL